MEHFFKIKTVIQLATIEVPVHFYQLLSSTVPVSSFDTVVLTSFKFQVAFNNCAQLPFGLKWHLLPNFSP
jgi:hypothetical protein